MARDAHGLPVPIFEILVKLDECEPHKIRDAAREPIAYVNCAVDQEFIEHALNNIVECRDIVRRLVELGSIGDPVLRYELVQDAAKLWAKMTGETDDRA